MIRLLGHWGGIRGAERQFATLVYKCMVMSWSSGAKLTRRLPGFMLLRRLEGFSFEGGTMAASTVRPRFKACKQLSL